MMRGKTLRDQNDFWILEVLASRMRKFRKKLMCIGLVFFTLHFIVLPIHIAVMEAIIVDSRASGIGLYQENCCKNQTVIDDGMPTSEVTSPGVQPDEYGPQSRGGWLLNPRAPHVGHLIDVRLCRSLEDIFKGKHVLDLGAGVGLYGRCFLHKKKLLFPEIPEADQQFFRAVQTHEAWWRNSSQVVKSWTGYDGSPNVENVTKGFVKYMDLTQPQTFPYPHKWDWVMSLEVGEHIPAKFENAFLSNILKPVKEGIVLSWARRGQEGWGHVNLLNNDEVVERMISRGFYHRRDLSKKLREAARFGHFRTNVMVFQPVTPDAPLDATELAQSEQ